MMSIKEYFKSLIRVGGGKEDMLYLRLMWKYNS